MRIRSWAIDYSLRCIRGEPLDLRARIWLLLLGLVSSIYGLVVRLRAIGYSMGLLGRSKLPAPVISVGNISLGGTAKTPMVEKIAGAFSKEKKRVSILSRGYGRSSYRETLVVSDGSRLLARFPESGDEAYLLAKNLPSVAVLVGKDRFLTGSLAIESMKAEMIILDDGFQHLPLERNLDLVLLDASDPFGHGHLFPRGLLREPIGHLSRADLFVIVKGREDEDLGEISKSLGRVNPRASIFSAMRYPLFLVRMPEENRQELEAIRGKRSIALSGIANPASFLSVLEQLGAEVIRSFSFPDHHPYSLEELGRILNWAQQAGVEALLTTQKDAVRMPLDFFPCPIPLIYPRIEIRISQEEEFFSLLRRVVSPS